MSFSKTVATRFRTDVTFWRVARREFDDIDRKVFIQLNGYVSKTAFQAGAAPLEVVPLTNEDGLDYLACTTATTRRQLADHILAVVPRFSGGTAE